MKTIIACFFCFPVLAMAQINVPQTPTFNTPKPYEIKTNTQELPNTPYQNPQETETDIYKQSLEEQKKQQATQKQLQLDILELNDKAQSFEFPSNMNLPGAINYRQAFEEITSMIEGEYPYSLGHTNFLVENAYYNNAGNYLQFKQIVSNIGILIKEKIKELNLNENSNLDKNFMLFLFFSDTLNFSSNNFTHYPFQYDFEDYDGNMDWSQTFVLKLLSEHSGQCRSLPLLYLILAEEIGAKAYLAFSPNHSYVKFQDENGAWYNLELTNNIMITDARILESGYIKAEALQNEVYMYPLDKNGILSHMLTDLAKGYIVKYGYDSFVEQVINKAIELEPKNIFAQLVKSNYLTYKLFYVERLLGLTPQNYQNIKNYPQAVTLYKERNAQYDYIDAIGYEEMPQDAYIDWLNSMKEEQQKRESESIVKEIKSSVVKIIKD